MPFIFVAILALLAGCETMPSSPLLPAEGPPPVATEQTRKITYEEAKRFDDFLNNTLSVDEVNLLVQSCREKPDHSVFCFTVLNKEILEKIAQNERPKNSNHSNGKAVYPKLRGKSVANWETLRNATPKTLLPGLSSFSLHDLKLLQTKALTETRCPNNVTVAVAATLEKWLPKEISTSEIAALYEKAGSCVWPHGKEDTANFLLRAGLFYTLKGNYHRAKKVLLKAAEAYPEFQAKTLYWLYRVSTALSNHTEAQSYLERLQSEYPLSFHTIVALTFLNQDPAEKIFNFSYEHKKRSERIDRVNTLIEQVEALHEFGFKKNAIRILDWAIAESQETEPEFKLYLAHLKKQQGDFLRKFALLSELFYRNPTLIGKNTIELFFPKAFFPVFQKNSVGLDPYLLLAVARQESAFNTNAVSRADARGILQLLPAVGRKLSMHSKTNLFDPEVNVELGAQYLADLLKEFNAQIHLALAAYNAGPGNVLNWMTRYETTDPILFIDLIPYRETRHYVATVLRNYYWYRRIETTNGDPVGIFSLSTALPAKDAVKEN